MAITQTLVTSFKKESWQAIHALETDTIHIALYTGAAALDSSTTVYTATDETTGTGYTAGGQTLAGAVISTDGTTVYVSFSDAVWAGAEFTARGALIYNASKANRAIAVLDFGADKTAVSTFTVQMPANGASTAIIRFA